MYENWSNFLDSFWSHTKTYWIQYKQFWEELYAFQILAHIDILASLSIINITDDMYKEESFTEYLELTLHAWHGKSLSKMYFWMVNECENNIPLFVHLHRISWVTRGIVKQQ